MVTGCLQAAWEIKSWKILAFKSIAGHSKRKSLNTGCVLASAKLNRLKRGLLRVMVGRRLDMGIIVWYHMDLPFLTVILKSTIRKINLFNSNQEILSTFIIIVQRHSWHLWRETSILQWMYKEEREKSMHYAHICRSMILKLN